MLTYTETGNLRKEKLEAQKSNSTEVVLSCGNANQAKLRYGTKAKENNKKTTNPSKVPAGLIDSKVNVK